MGKLNRQLRHEAYGVSEYCYNKYLKKYDKCAPENIKKEKEKKAKSNQDWLSKNWIPLLSLLVAIAALIVSLLR